ncbi:MAG TPA: hypothetical protein VFA30_09120 [Gaiellaceae bacterium]|nr:hypothetical protein [Gaiellaceae bacterium]
MTRRALKPWLVGALVFVAACSPPWVGLFSGRGIGDMYLYRMYGHRMQDGLWPYHQFFFDWPPGSVLPVLWPVLPPGSYYDWFHVFDAAYAICALGAVAYVLAALGARGVRLYGGVIAAASFPFALGAISINSLDYWPALFATAGLGALLVGRDRLAFGLLGFGVVAKVYPVVMLPVALVWVWRRRGRAQALWSLAAAAAVVVAVSLPFLIVGYSGLGFSTYTQFKRGLQMESLPATLLLVGSRLGIHHVHVVVGSPYSLNVAGRVGDAAGLLFTLVLVAALLWVYLAYVAGRDEPQRLVNACVAAVAAYVAFNRVLSPQYLVWLIPLVPLVGGAWGLVAVACLFLACGLTMTWFPGRFWHLVHVSPVAWFALARNIAVVAVFVAVFMPVLRTMERRIRYAVRASIVGRPYFHATKTNQASDHASASPASAVRSAIPRRHQAGRQ